MAQFYQPLDLQHLLINTLAGNMALFYIMGTIVISALASYFRMPGGIYAVMIALFTLFMAKFMASGAVVVLIVIVTGLLTFYLVGKLTKN